MSTQRVLLLRRLPDAAGAALRAAGLTVECTGVDASPAHEQLLERVPGVAALIPTFPDRVDADLLAAAGEPLRIVANFGVGYDNIDVDACRARGVRVSNTPGVLTEATAEITWALILATARRIVEGDRLVRGGSWNGAEPLQLLGQELHGATLGIVGAGRIGSATARRAPGFGMKVLYAHPRPNDALEQFIGARRVELDALLAESDVVSLHVPMRPENQHLIAAEQLARLKPGAILINTARGPVVDEAALADALRAGRLAGAGLDVYENEPRLTSGLADLENVVVLPHLGSATRKTRNRMAQMAAANVIAALSGREPPNAVL